MSRDQVEFDKFAQNYEELFKSWVKLSGSSREYFARSRIEWLSHLLNQRNAGRRRVMDYGCGTGISLPLLVEILGCDHLVGVDVSEESLAVARERTQGMDIQLATPADHAPKGDLDVVICNGVFHHIPVAERPAAVSYIYDCLRPGGFFALWENNPWNPVQAVLMKVCEIDKQAIPLSPPESRALLISRNFSLVRTDFRFFVPRYLGLLRPVEKWFNKLPLGAQYQVLACKEKCVRNE